MLRRGQPHLVGRRAQDHVRQDVELLGLADRLRGVLRVERIAPGDQVVQELHHGGHAVGRDAQARDPVRVERIGDPLRDRVRRRGVADVRLGVVREGREQLLDLLIRPVRLIHGVERGHLPLRPGTAPLLVSVGLKMYSSQFNVRKVKRVVHCLM